MNSKQSYVYCKFLSRTVQVKKTKKFTDAKLSKARYQMYLIQCLSLFFFYIKIYVRAVLLELQLKSFLW